jgi:xanthine/uracil/vitamin C permease (AzgA family)
MADRPDDELLAEGEELRRLSAAAKLFDVRRVIGGLFVVYGVIVTLLGIFDGDAEVAKAAGVRINLWMGLAMLALGGLFLLWLWWRPAAPPATPPAAPPDGAAEN